MGDRHDAEEPCLRFEHLLKASKCRRYCYRDAEDAQAEIYLPHTEAMDLGGLLLHCSRVYADFVSLQVPDASVFCLFQATLTGHALTEWQIIFEAIPDGTDMTLGQLKIEMQHLITRYTAEEDKATLLTYIRNGCKPPKVTCRQLLSLQAMLNTIADFLPGLEASLTAEELKQAYFSAMPVAWRNRWTTAGCSLHSTSISELQTYLAQQERLSNKLQEQNNARHSQQQPCTCRQADAQLDQRPARRHHAGSAHAPAQRGHPAQAARSNRAGDCPQRRHINGGGPAAQDANSIQIADTAACPVHPGANHAWGECRQNARNAGRPRRNHAASAHVAKNLAQNAEDEAGDEPLIIESHPSKVPPLEEEPQSQVEDVVMDKVQVPVAVAQPAIRTSMAHSSTWGMSGWTTRTANNNNQATAAPTIVVASAAAAPTVPTAVAENATPNELHSLCICFEGKDIEGREERLLAYLCCTYDKQLWTRSTMPSPLQPHPKVFLEAEMAYRDLLFGQTLLLQKGFPEAKLPEIMSVLSELEEVTYFSDPLRFQCPTSIYRKSNKQTEALHEPLAFTFTEAESHKVKNHPDKDKLWRFLRRRYEAHNMLEPVQLPSKERLCQLWASAQRIVNIQDIKELQRRSAQANTTQSTNEDRLVFTTAGSVTTEPTAASTNVDNEKNSTGDLSDKENHTADNSKPAAST